MSASELNSRELQKQFLKTIDKTHVGAAASKLLAASIGDMVTVLSRSPAHKHYSLADIEWMVLPPIMVGQFHIVEITHRDRGFTGPIAVLTWAFVSEETDLRLARIGDSRIRLRPDEWKSGDIAWLIDVGGSAEGVKAGLQWLKDGPFKQQVLKMVLRGKDGLAQVTQLDAVMAEPLGSLQNRDWQDFRV